MVAPGSGGAGVTGVRIRGTARGGLRMSSEPNLYAPPSASLEAERGAPSGARYGPYRDAGFRGGLAIVGLALSALFTIAFFLAFPKPPASPEDPRALQLAALAVFAV